MEQIVKNADTFLHVLETAHSSRVASWQTDNLNKALSWADHHQQLYQSYRDRDKIRSVLDIEFKKLAYRNCILVNAFSFEFMRNCKDFLIGILKQNSSLGPELLNSLPDSILNTENTQIFNCLLNIDKTLRRDDPYVDDVMTAICDTVEEAVRFQRGCPVVTTAPLRAVTTLLTRVYNIDKTRQLFLNCFIRGKETVRHTMVEWLEKFGTDLWSVSDVKLLTKCSALNPDFCKLHVLHVVKLFSLVCTSYRSQHPIVIPETHQNSNQVIRDCSANLEQDADVLQDPAKDLIFGSIMDKTNSLNDARGDLVDLSEHLVLLHATSCYLIVEELLLSLCKHEKCGTLARTYSDFLSQKR